MKIESALRSINKRVEEYVDVFGKSSIEFNIAKSMLYTAVNVDNLDLPLLNYNKGVMTFKRGKEAIREITNNPVLEENILNLWESLKKMGSAKTIISRDYLDTKGISSFAKETGFTNEEVTNIVRQESAERYSSLYNDVDDLDSGKVIDEIDEIAGDEDSEDLLDMLSDILSDFYRTGKGVEKDRKWNDITRKFNEYKYAKEQQQRLKAGEWEDK
jgi:hypothetical protein